MCSKVSLGSRDLLFALPSEMRIASLDSRKLNMNDELTDRATTEITGLVERTVAEQRLPGIAVGIVNGQSLKWSQGFGFADLDTQRPFTRESICRVASITKTFTTTAILQLRDEGRLDLDDPLERHIREFSTTQARAGSIARVTIRRMLSHHAGLTTEVPLPCWDVQEFPTREAVLAAIPRMEVVIPQDSAFKYSNIAFGLLGEVISRVAGRPYFDYVCDEILAPLGMEFSFFERNDEMRQSLATGYLPNPYDDELLPAPYVPLNGVAACGQLHSNVVDLAKWISLQFRTDIDKRNGSQVVNGSTIEESHRPQYLESDWSIGYCLGWRANRFGNRVYHGHGGGIFGFASQILFSKPQQIGVICLTNRWPYSGMLNIAAKILDCCLADNESRPAMTIEVATRTTPDAVNEFLGHYVAAPAIPVSVEYRDGALRLVNPHSAGYSLHAPAKLEPTADPNVFVVSGGRGSGENVVFQRDEGSRWWFELGGFRYRR